MQKLFVAATVAAFLTISSFAQQSRKDEDSLRSLIGQLLAAQTAYDAPALDRIFTADYVEISPVGEYDPRTKVLGFYAPAEKVKMAGMKVSVEPTEYSIRIYKGFAIAIARLNYSMTNNGIELPPRSIRATFVCRKEKSGWKIASAQYTSMRPSVPVKT